jgi:hypothetical protein
VECIITGYHSPFQQVIACTFQPLSSHICLSQLPHSHSSHSSLFQFPNGNMKLTATTLALLPLACTAHQGIQRHLKRPEQHTWNYKLDFLNSNPYLQPDRPTIHHEKRAADTEKRQKSLSSSKAKISNPSHHHTTPPPTISNRRTPSPA